MYDCSLIETQKQNNSMSENTGNQTANFIELAGDIVSAYVSNNSVPTSELSFLI